MVINGILAGRGKGLLLSLLLSFFSLALLLYFTWEEETLASLELLNPWSLAWAFLMVIGLWLVEGLRVKAILKSVGSTGHIPLLAAARVFLVTFFCAGVTPWALGEWPSHIVALNRNNIPAGEAAAAALLRAFLTKGLFLLWSGVIFFYYDNLGVGLSTGGLFRGAFTAVALTSFAYIVIMLKPGLIVGLLTILSKFRWTRRLYDENKGLARFLQLLLAEAQRFRGSLGQMLHRGPLFLLWSFSLTFLYWSLYFSIAPVILWGFGLNPPYFTALSWQVMITLILQYVPLPGGSGLAEFGAASLFAGFVPAPLLGLFITAWRFFTYYVSLFSGGLAFFFLLKNE